MDKEVVEMVSEKDVEVVTNEEANRILPRENTYLYGWGKKGEQEFAIVVQFDDKGKLQKVYHIF